MQWSVLAGFKGYRTLSEIPIYLDGDGSISTISWDAITPSGTKIEIYTSVSFNDGLDWTNWKRVENGGAIPDILANTSLKNAKLKFRVFAESEFDNITPILKEITIYLEPVIYFENKGDVNLKPEIWIEKIGNGDFSLINTSHNNEEFKFTNLIDGEVVYVDNERQDIETSLATTYRYKDFNDNYLDMPIGVNVFKVQGSAKIKFRYQFKLI